MKNLLITLIAMITFININAASAENFTFKEYLETQDGTEVRLGDDSKGNRVNLLASELEKNIESIDTTEEVEAFLEIKISAITFYMTKNHEHINGIEIEYNNGETESIGSKNGRRNRKVIDSSDEINEIKIFAKEKEDNQDCRTGKAKAIKVRFKTKNNGTLWYGKDRKSDCVREQKNHGQRLVGLYATYKNGKVFSIGPIWMRDISSDSLVFEDIQVLDSADNEFNILTSIESSSDFINMTNGDSPWIESLSASRNEYVNNTWTNRQQYMETFGVNLGMNVSYGAGATSGSVSVDVSEQFSQLQEETIGVDQGSGKDVEKTFDIDQITESKSVWGSWITYDMMTINQKYVARFRDDSSCDYYNDPNAECDYVEIEGTLESSTFTQSSHIIAHIGEVDTDDKIIYIDENAFLSSDTLENMVNSLENRYNLYEVQVVNGLN